MTNKFSIMIVKRQGRNVECDVFGRPICHHFIGNVDGEFIEIEKVAVNIKELIDPEFAVVMTQYEPDGQIHWIY